MKVKDTGKIPVYHVETGERYGTFWLSAWEAVILWTLARITFFVVCIALIVESVRLVLG